MDSHIPLERCLADYLAKPWDTLDLVQVARRFNVLPVYCDLGGALFISLKGQVMALDYDEEIVKLRPEEDPALRLVAAVAAAEKYPELRSLVPRRPASSPDCDECEGTGRVTVHQLRCGGCFSLGWKIAL